MEKQLIMMKRIFKIRKQSRIAIPKNNLWFFSESDAEEKTFVSEKPRVRNDRYSIMNEDLTRYPLENSGRNSKKQKCSFVVDWQMSDTF